MKPYTCPSTRMDVAALLTEGYSLCRRSRRIGWKCCNAETVPSGSFPQHWPPVWRQRCVLPHACFLFLFFSSSGRAGHTSAALHHSIRTCLSPEMDRFRCLFPFLNVIDWCCGFLSKMASVIFIQRQPGASCFSLGPCVAMATPAVQSALPEET